MADGWILQKVLRISTAATRDLLASSAGHLTFAQDRKRLAIHDGTSHRELAYRSDFPIGMVFPMDFEVATSETFPAVQRNANQDLTLAQWPDLVPLLRAAKANFGGVQDFSCSVSGNVVTFPDTAEGRAAVNILKAEAIVAAWQQGGEIANFAGGEIYDATGNRRCITVAGVEYNYTAVSAVNRQVTTVGSPTSGTQTVSIYPFRIAGSTGARLFKIAGFAPIAAGDAGIEVVGGFRRMDRGQGHWHEWFNTTGGGPSVGYTGTGSQAETSLGALKYVRNPTTDGTNGTPRTGKTTDPRTAGLYFYSWGGRYVA